MIARDSWIIFKGEILGVLPFFVIINLLWMQLNNFADSIIRAIRGCHFSIGSTLNRDLSVIQLMGHYLCLLQSQHLSLRLLELVVLFVKRFCLLKVVLLILDFIVNPRFTHFLDELSYISDSVLHLIEDVLGVDLLPFSIQVILSNRVENHAIGKLFSFVFGYFEVSLVGEIRTDTKFIPKEALDGVIEIIFNHLTIRFAFSVSTVQIIECSGVIRSLYI